MQIYRYPSTAAEKKLTAISRRSLAFRKKDIQAVSRILDDVRRNGDKALVAGFARNGYSAELARQRIAVGCNWMAIPGREYTLNDCVKINAATSEKNMAEEPSTGIGRM